MVCGGVPDSAAPRCLHTPRRRRTRAGGRCPTCSIADAQPRCVTELDLAGAEAAMHREYDLDGIMPEDHPAADAADIAWRLTHGVPVTGPWRKVGTVVPK